MLDLGFLTLLIAWSAGISLWLLRRLVPVPEHPADALALTVPLGLGTLALAALGLSEVEGLTRAGLGGVLAFGGLAVGSAKAWWGSKT